MGAAPSAYDDPQVRSWFVTYQRLAASPSAVVAIESICRDIDMRPVLGSIAVPTMVLHRTGDEIESIEAGSISELTDPRCEIRGAQGR
jgi:hypothetical protein